MKQLTFLAIMLLISTTPVFASGLSAQQSITAAWDITQRLADLLDRSDTTQANKLLAQLKDKADNYVYKQDYTHTKTKTIREILSQSLYALADAGYSYEDNLRRYTSDTLWVSLLFPRQAMILPDQNPVEPIEYPDRIDLYGEINHYDDTWSRIITIQDASSLDEVLQVITDTANSKRDDGYICGYEVTSMQSDIFQQLTNITVQSTDSIDICRHTPYQVIKWSQQSSKVAFRNMGQTISWDMNYSDGQFQIYDSLMIRSFRFENPTR